MDGKKGTVIELEWARRYKLIQEPIPLHPRGIYEGNGRTTSQHPDQEILDTPEHGVCESMGVPISEVEDNKDHLLPYTPMDWRSVADHYLSRGSKEQHI